MGKMDIPNTTEKEKPKSIKDLIGESPDAIIVISGASKYNEKKGRYEMGSFSDADDSALVAGGKDRVIAAAEIHNAFPESILVPTSQNTNPEIPTYASLISAHLIQLGIPPEKIIEEPQSYRTIDGLKNSLLLAYEKGWRKLVFLTSGFHIPRVQKMLEHILEFSQNEKEKEKLVEITEAIEQGRITLQTISADDVLPLRSKHYDAYLNAVKELPGYKARVELEQKGIRDITEGRYVFSAPNTKNPIPSESKGASETLVKDPEVDDSHSEASAKDGEKPIEEEKN